jgi:uncharacterized protein YecT (DUF1311 family)
MLPTLYFVLQQQVVSKISTHQLMKQFIFLTTFLFLGYLSFAQTDEPKEITPQILQKIKADVEREVPGLKQQLTEQELNDDEIEFALDTFRIEQIATKRIEIDYSTSGMNITVDEMTASYDKLMNKYYNKLLQLLTPEDKKVLITAQRAWLLFRDAEAKLIGTMTKKEYSGGGTMQSNIATGYYTAHVAKRTWDIFTYYDNVIKDK